MTGRLSRMKAEAEGLVPPRLLTPGEEITVAAPGRLRMDGAAKVAKEVNRARIAVAGIAFAAAFALIGARATTLAMGGGAEDVAATPTAATAPLTMSRADIVDRNGVLLATNLPTVDLYADARHVIDPAAAARDLVAVLPELNYAEVLDKLSSERAFVYLKRDLTPKQQKAVNALGIPGIDFQDGESRVYPHGRVLSHVIGLTDVDGKGIAGIERAFEGRLERSPAKPLALSVDVRVQHLVREELQRSIDAFSAKGGAGLVVDVRSGEVLAMVSLPDFDPNHPPAVTDPAMFNRATKGVYEMGSTFKLFNAAAALEAGTATVESRYDATRPLKVANFTIRDFHAEKRPLNVAEILVHSSNIGAALMAAELGTDAQRAFLGRLGLLHASAIELPEVGSPLIPAPWRPINTMTIAYGHGISVTPLHVVNAVSTLVNGGVYRPATLIKSDGALIAGGEQVLSPRTSTTMRRLMRRVVEEGSGRNANVEGYLVGGKTGSAEKIGADGHYRSDSVITSFVAAFPMSAPRYVVLAMLDEPQGTKATFGYATAGWNATPTVGHIVERLAPMMGLSPRFEGFGNDGNGGGLIEASLRAPDMARGGAGAAE